MKRDLDQLTDREFDLLIVGGGITGAGVALDATLRGYQVALVEKGDFAGGTSSVSSKLVHGGLRYLEHGHIHLVYEALHERRRLLQNAPHLVKPLRFIVPVYEGGRVPRWKLRLGMTIYDLLAGRENLRQSGPLTRRQVVGTFPTLRPARLLSGAAYYDAQMDDARLCLEVVKTAAGCGARVANYIALAAFEKREGKITAARVTDQIGGHEFTIRARQFVNATGPWVDQICRLDGDTDLPHLQPTKGVHVILPDQQLSSAFLLFHPRDGRVFFVIPWFGKTLVGTTDTPCEESPAQLTVSTQDVEYLLEGHQHYFRTEMDRTKVLNTFVGLRPLMRQKPGAPSSLSREFQLIHSSSGLLSVVGGKYTTYRRMAEVIVDKLAQIGGVTPQQRAKSRKKRVDTRDYRLDGTPPGGWQHYLVEASDALQERGLLNRFQARHLVQRYGQRAHEVAASIEKDATLGEAIVAGEPDLKGELAYQRAHEMAMTPADHLLRRTRLGLFYPHLLQGNLSARLHP